MYPMLDIDQITEKADQLFSFTEAATKTGLADRSIPSVDSIHGQDVNILKMILATVLILEGGGQSELGSALFDTVRGACESKLGEPPDIGGLRLLVIMVRSVNETYVQPMLSNSVGSISIPARGRGPSLSNHWSCGSLEF